MHYAWPILLILLNTCWLALIVPGLPGTWLMVASALIADWLVKGPEPMFSVWTLVVVTGLAAVGEVVEFFAGVGGAKRGGGTRRGAVGAMVGGLIGAIVMSVPIPCFGTLLGACLGAALGAAVGEMTGGMQTEESVRAGVGAGVGRFVGTIIKLGIGTVIWLVIALGRSGRKQRAGPRSRRVRTGVARILRWRGRGIAPVMAGLPGEFRAGHVSTSRLCSLGF